MNKKVLIVTGAGLLVGFAEAMIYYNLGANKKNEKFQIQYPKGKELLETVGIVILTALATAALSNIIENGMPIKKSLTPQIA